METGAGVVGAETYSDVSFADEYYAARPHLALAIEWTAADSGNKEGALREASAFVDAHYGPHYRGTRSGRVQGLEWPRTSALDDGGYALPGLPLELQHVTCELAARALSDPLSKDAGRGGRVKRNKVEGVIEQEFFDGAPVETKYGVIIGMLHGILDGTQNNNPSWDWL